MNCTVFQGVQDSTNATGNNQTVKNPKLQFILLALLATRLEKKRVNTILDKLSGTSELVSDSSSANPAWF